MTPTTTPDWLTLHEGTLKPGVQAETTLVLISGRPMYRLEVRPAEGKFICAVSNTVNGKRLDSPTATFPTPDAAIAGGLDQLRNQLGW